MVTRDVPFAIDGSVCALAIAQADLTTLIRALGPDQDLDGLRPLLRDFGESNQAPTNEWTACGEELHYWRYVGDVLDPSPPHASTLLTVRASVHLPPGLLKSNGGSSDTVARGAQVDFLSALQSASQRIYALMFASSFDQSLFGAWQFSSVDSWQGSNRYPGTRWTLSRLLHYALARVIQRNGDYALYDDRWWRLAAAERTYNDSELELVIRDSIDRERRKFERLQLRLNSHEPAIRRDAISDEVKIFVWRRDEGACVKCGSNRKLEYDHIIPIARGGANSARNIQLLCEGCNRSKSDRIV